MSDCRRTYHERAISNRFRHGFVFFRAGQHRLSVYCGPRIPKSHIVWIHYPQTAKSKVAHRPGGSANVEGITRVHQDDAQTIEFGRKRQAVGILRQSKFGHCLSVIVILNKRSLRSEEPIPSLTRESGRAALTPLPALTERKRPKGAFGSLPYHTSEPLNIRSKRRAATRFYTGVKM